MTGASSSDVFATAIRTNMTPQSVSTRVASSSVNAYGEATFSGDATAYPCYVERTVNQPAGIDENATVEFTVYIPDQTVALTVDSQITLPAPISATRPIIAVETLADPLGQVGQVIYVGRLNR